MKPKRLSEEQMADIRLDLDIVQLPRLGLFQRDVSGLLDHIDAIETELAEAKRDTELRKLAADIFRLSEYDWFLPCTMPEICGKYNELLGECPTCIACAEKTELIERTAPYSQSDSAIAQSKDPG